MSQLRTMCEPLNTTGGKGSEVTLVLDGGARSEGMIEGLGEEEVKFVVIVSSKIIMMNTFSVGLVLTDYT